VERTKRVHNDISEEDKNSMFQKSWTKTLDRNQKYSRSQIDL